VVTVVDAASTLGDVVDATHLSLLEGVARLAVAALLGGLVGLEREFAGREAGMRTHALLSLGAALFALVSVGGFSEFAVASNNTNVLLDVTRIASYVAAAVGFIGGGVIVKGREGVRGLTTAATLWVTCAIGLACGVGLLALATVVAACALATLLFDRPLRVVRRRLGIAASTVVITTPATASLSHVGELLRRLDALSARDVRVASGDNGGETRITAKVDQSHILELLHDTREAGFTMEFDADPLEPGVPADRVGSAADRAD
jgi:putative Mg2+ transporter-C (MgtC) family protein